MPARTARWPVQDLDLEVAGGEIVCVAGVQGNGQTELAEALLGVVPIVKGSMRLDGKPLAGLTPRETIDAGLGFVPEDRKQNGCVGSFTVAENLILNHFDEPPYARGIALDLAKIRQNANHRVSRVRHSYAVDRVSSVISFGRQPAEGGFGPRAVSGRWRCWSHASPPAGLDVGAIEFVHKRLIDERDRGTAVVIVSTELGRGRRPGRPDRGDVSRPHRRDRAAGHLARGARP